MNLTKVKRHIFFNHKKLQFKWFFYEKLYLKKKYIIVKCLSIVNILTYSKIIKFIWHKRHIRYVLNSLLKSTTIILNIYKFKFRPYLGQIT